MEKRKQISTFEIEFSNHSEPQLNQALKNESDLINYSFYLDLIVSRLAPALSHQLATNLFHLSQDSLKQLKSKGEQGSNPLLRQQSQQWTRTLTKASNLGKAQIKSQLFQETDGTLTSEVRFSPEFSEKLSYLYCASQEFLFEEYYKQTNTGGKHILAVMIMTQCRFYLEAGLSTPETLGHIPSAALKIIASLTETLSNS